MGKTIAEQIAEAKDEIRKLGNREKRLLQSHNTELRKLRVRRLIERGAIAESLISGADEMTGEQFKSFLEKILLKE
jgi:hypothetical protein